MSDSISRSDYIKRNEALGCLEEWYAKVHKPEKISELADILAGYSAYKDILKIPAEDAVAVVRCRDCKKASVRRYEFNNEIYSVYCYRFYKETKEDDFCSWGERRDENGES